MTTPIPSQELLDEKQLKRFLMPSITEVFKLRVALLGTTDQIKDRWVQSRITCRDFQKRVSTAIHEYNESQRPSSKARFQRTHQTGLLDEPFNRKMVVDKLACFIMISPDDEIANQLFTAVKQEYISTYQGKRVIGLLKDIKRQALTFHRGDKEAKALSENWWNNYIVKSESEFTLPEKFFYSMPDSLASLPCVTSAVVLMLLKYLGLNNESILKWTGGGILAILLVAFLYKQFVQTTVAAPARTSEETIQDIYQRLIRELRLLSVIERPVQEESSAIAFPAQGSLPDPKAKIDECDEDDKEDGETSAVKPPKIKTRKQVSATEPPTRAVPSFFQPSLVPSAIPQGISQRIDQRLHELKIQGDYKIVRFDWFSAIFWAVLPFKIIENETLTSSFLNSFEKGLSQNHKAHAIVFAGSGLRFEIRIPADPRIFNNEGDIIKISAKERIVIFRRYVDKHEDTLDLKLR